MTIQPKLVTVITAAKNSKSVIKRCINSVANQTYKHIEHIIVLGKSTDGTNNVIDSYMLANPQHNIRILYESAPGIYPALNYAIRKSKGKFLLILGSDDWLEPFCIQELLDAIQQNRSDFAVGYAKIIDPSIQKLDKIFKISEFDERILMGLMPFCHQALLASKECFDVCGLFNEQLTIASDYQWIKLLFLQKMKMAVVHKCVVNFYKGGISDLNDQLAVNEMISCIQDQYNVKYENAKSLLDLLLGEERINKSNITSLIKELTDVNAVKSIALLLMEQLDKVKIL